MRTSIQLVLKPSFIGRTLHHTSFVLLDEWEDLLSSKVEGNLDARTVAIEGGSLN